MDERPQTQYHYHVRLLEKLNIMEHALLTIARSDIANLGNLSGEYIRNIAVEALNKAAVK